MSEDMTDYGKASIRTMCPCCGENKEYTVEGTKAQMVTAKVFLGDDQAHIEVFRSSSGLAYIYVNDKNGKTVHKMTAWTDGCLDYDYGDGIEGNFGDVIKKYPTKIADAINQMDTTAAEAD